MRPLLAAALIAAAAIAAGCARDRVEEAGPQTSRSFPVGNFAKLEVAGSYDVRVRTGGKPGVSVTGPANVIDQMVVEVKGDELKIHPKRDGAFSRGIRFGRHAPVTVEVSAPSLSAATIAGSGDISIDRVTGAVFDGAIAGSGSLALSAIEVETLKLSIAGSGGVSGTGKAVTGDYSIAGSGDLDVSKVAHRDLDVSIAGSGDVRAQASGNADISIMGSGNVTVTGGAKCKISKMGSGTANCS